VRVIPLNILLRLVSVDGVTCLLWAVTGGLSVVRYFVQTVEYVGRLKANFKLPRLGSVAASVCHVRLTEVQAELWVTVEPVY